MIEELVCRGCHAQQWLGCHAPGLHAEILLTDRPLVTS